MTGASNVVHPHLPTLKISYKNHARTIFFGRPSSLLLKKEGWKGVYRQGRRMHFVDEQWVNYVRNTGDSQTHATIHQHLAGGCDECLEDQRIWKEVYLSTQRESDYLPPQELVRNTIGYLSMSVKPPSRLSHFAELLFDSAFQPFALGIGARGSGSRILLYQSGDVRVDMRMERSCSDRMNVTGQIFDMNVPDQVVGHAPVSLVEGSRSLVRTFTNELGEFELNLPMYKDLCMAFEVEGRQVLISLGVADATRWTASE